MSLSVVISTYNRRDLLKKGLESIKGIADEIIIIDNTSNDDSLAVAKKYTKHVYVKENNPMLNVNKNFGLKKATKDWTLYLDDDEELTPELAQEVKNITQVNQDEAGYWIPRKNIIFGKWIENEMWWPDYQLRLFRSGKGKYPEKHAHEMITVDGKTASLIHPMIHQNYTSISQYIYKLDKFYTESEAQQILSSGKIVTWVDAIRFPVNDFLKIFFLQKGYKDGLHGLVLAILQAFYSEVVFAKVWEKQGFQQYNSKYFLKDVQKEFKRVAGEFRYWFLSSFIRETKNPFTKTILRIGRKISAKKL